jgi:F-type H+-transporting ATPase subunit gamma
MKMVSAAKLRKAQDAIIQMRPYANKLRDILVSLTESIEDEHDNIYGTRRELKHVLILAISSNKGLCGAFNANVAKRVIHLLENDYKNLDAKGHVDVFVMGKKAAELLKAKGRIPAETHHDILDTPSYELVANLAKRVMASFASGLYDEVRIVYNQFRNAAVQDLIEEQYLPIQPPEKNPHDHSHLDYILEPSKKQIVKELIPKSLKIQLYKAFLDSIASEHGARMTAMHKASDNATELIKELRLDYNKARQASITTEILEIVGGAEALKG